MADTVTVVTSFPKELTGAYKKAYDAKLLGEFLRYEVRVSGARVVVDQAHARGEAALATGTPVTLAVPAAEIRFIAL